MKKRIILFCVFLAIFSQMIFMGEHNVFYANYISLLVLPIFLFSLKTIKFSYHIKVLISLQVLIICSYLWTDEQSSITLKSYYPFFITTFFILSIYNLMIQQKSIRPIYWAFWLCSLFNFLILLKILPQELFFVLEYWEKRFYGTFNNPNVGAMAFVFSLLFADYELKNKIKSNIYFYFLVTIILISTVLVFVTLSKKGLVLVILYLLSKLYVKKGSSLFTKRSLLFFSLFLLSINFIPSGFISDLSDNTLNRVNVSLAQSNSNSAFVTGSTTERLYFIDRGINGFFDAPFFGHGFKSFESKFTLYSHNNYIEFLYSFGLIGLFLYYSMYFKIYKMAFKVDANTKVLFLFSLLCLSFIDIAAVTYSTKTIQYFICVLFILFETQQHKVTNNG